MPTPPLLIAQSETSYSGLAAKPIPETDVVAGDVLVVYMAAGYSTASFTISNDGAALTWTLEDSVLDQADYCDVMVWSTIAPADRTNLVVTVTRVEALMVSFITGMLVFRGSDGTGATASENAQNTAPSMDITTTLDLSAVLVVNADFDFKDGSSRVWRTGAGSLIELTYVLNSDIGFYLGYHPDVGAAALQTVGLSAPTGQRSSIVALEALAGILLDVYVGSLIIKRKR